MTDLRAAVEGLELDDNFDPTYRAGYYKAVRQVFNLIPEGAVLVTEEGLARALVETYPVGAVLPSQARAHAAAILRRLRETP